MTFQVERQGERGCSGDLRNTRDVGAAGGQHDTGSAPLAFEHGQDRIGPRLARNGEAHVEPLPDGNRKTTPAERHDAGAVDGDQLPLQVPPKLSGKPSSAMPPAGVGGPEIPGTPSCHQGGVRPWQWIRLGSSILFPTRTRKGLPISVLTPNVPSG